MLSGSRPRIADVAARAGVSLGTVSHVIHRPHLVLPETQERVRAAMAELGYVPNLLARQLRQGRSDTVGMVVTHAGNPFHADLARAVDDIAASSGGVVMVCSSGGDVAREERLLTVFAEQQVRGVLLAPAGAPGPAVGLLRARGMPVVLLDGPAGYGGLAVRVDHRSGGRLAAEHLLASGCRRIVFVGGDSDLHQVADRERGAREITAAAASFRSLRAGGPTIADGEAIADAIIDEIRDDPGVPLGVFAANDLLAFGISRGLARRSGGMPADVRIVGYDDVALAAAAPGITTIRQPTTELGAAAMSLLDHPVDGAHEVLLEPTLIVRGSSLPLHNRDLNF